MAGRTSYYGGIVLDGLVFHIDAAKQESYAKRGLRYMQNGNNNLFIDFADVSKSPSTQNATGTIINGATFSNFCPYHLSGFNYYKDFYHNYSTSEWRQSAGIGTFYGNIEFDGIDDYINFGNTPEMNGITDLTVSAWIYVNRFKPGISPSGGTTSIVASRYNNLSTNNGWELGYNNDGVVWFGGRESASLYLSVTSSYYLEQAKIVGLSANGGWYNIVGTKKENEWKIYAAASNKYKDINNIAFINRRDFNNSLRGVAYQGLGDVPFSSNNLYLGSNGSRFHMNGRIMQVSIYNRALSLEEININHEVFSKRIFEIDGYLPLVGGSIQWETWENLNSGIGCLETFPNSGISAGWTYSNYGKSIRFNVSRSATSGCPVPEGTCNIQQIGYATASIVVGPVSTYMTLEFTGFGERVASNYDKIEFKLNNIVIAAANAPGDLGGNGQCLDGPVIKTFWDQLGTNPTPTGETTTNPYRYFLAANTTHILSVFFDTRDALYHYNSYYDAILGFEE